MASNLLSKFLPSQASEPSIYETLQLHGEAERDVSFGSIDNFQSDDLPAENTYRDDDLDAEPLRAQQRKGQGSARLEPQPSRRSGSAQDLDDGDDDVPQSLLIENDATNARRRAGPLGTELPPPVPGPANRETQAQWLAAQEQQRLHPAPIPQRVQNMKLGYRGRPLGITNPKEQAAWMWANVTNLDSFLGEVYDYYVGHGLSSILLTRVLTLLTTGFIVVFTTFLTQCIDYPRIPASKEMSQIIVPGCTRSMSGWTNVLLWAFSFFWIYKIFDYARDFRRLRSMQIFYRHLLEIPDSDMQTISWQEIVKKLMALREDHIMTANETRERHPWFFSKQSKHRMDAHDIANRLMRRENYLIGLINKDLLDFSVPLPFLRGRQLLSKTLEWYLQFCILDLVFTDEGQVNPLFLKDAHRGALIAGFRKRFIFAGFMSVFCAPISVIYFMLFYFFRYFNEYQRNPSQIGSRQYTPFARWKFREFNELPHLFERRVNMSYPFAARYIDQFPKDKTIQISSFVALVAGALASVLAVASLVDPESFLSFEITSERTVLFYLGVFGSIWAVARGAMPEENLVFDPEFALNNVTGYTHYLPGHWKGRLHTNEVRQEFASLYRMKLLIFFEELLSIILAPILLWVSLPASCDRLVDFFREFTIEVDGMGYVCSFAVFDFKRGDGDTPQLDQDAAKDLREEYYSTKDGKMLASYYGFIDNYAGGHRPGAQYPTATVRNSFHAPPAFPGLLSPSTASGAAAGPASRPDQSKTVRQNVGTGAGPIVASITGSQHGPRQTPRFAPNLGRASPVTSILLDPHHQPPSSHIHRQRIRGQYSRMGALRAPIEDEAEDSTNTRTDVGRKMLAQEAEEAGNESDLDDSWKITQAAMQAEQSREREGNNDEERAPGVLGLAYQFSKAQTKRRPGVQI